MAYFGENKYSSFYALPWEEGEQEKSRWQKVRKLLILKSF
jgi:hypothetical protein